MIFRVVAIVWVLKMSREGESGKGDFRNRAGA